MNGNGFKLAILILGALTTANSFAFTLIRVEGIKGVETKTTLHRRCTLTDNGILIEKNIGSWATASQRNLTRHFVAKANKLSLDVPLVQPNEDQLPDGTPVVNYWVTPNGAAQGFIFRSEQFPVGQAQRTISNPDDSSELLADFLDIACSAD